MTPADIFAAVLLAATAALQSVGLVTVGRWLVRRVQARASMAATARGREQAARDGGAT